MQRTKERLESYNFCQNVMQEDIMLQDNALMGPCKISSNTIEIFWRCSEITVHNPYIFSDVIVVLLKEKRYSDSPFLTYNRIVVGITFKLNYWYLLQILHSIPKCWHIAACARDVARLESYGFKGKVPHCLPNGDYDELQCVGRNCYCRSFPAVYQDIVNMTKLPCCNCFV
jgi:hypothetical protein